jgi:hypothetical protein
MSLLACGQPSKETIPREANCAPELKPGVGRPHDREHRQHQGPRHRERSGAVPFVKRIEEEIAPDEVTAAKPPRVTAWWQAIQARPAFARTRIGPFV